VIGVSVLGSTGSIGVSTLDVVARHPERFRVCALSANRDLPKLAEQCLKFRPEYAVMADEGAARLLRQRLDAARLGIRVLSGVEGLEAIASLPHVDYVMAAIVGAAGLLPALAAVRSGKRLLLANKEALVMSGGLFIAEARRHGARILPIDSEHNAIFQCLPEGFSGDLTSHGIRRILLTASGGPFRTIALDLLAEATPEQACAHPNWEMGRKISVDSATMMNKGLEVIEACWLFRAAPEQVQVVLHPQSVVHSMVQYADGSVLAQMGNPDMRTPIAHALGWPERIESGVASLDLFALGRLDFEAPEERRFPCLRLAYRAMEAGGTSPAILNAANEEAVQAFLEGRLRFTDIAEVVEYSLEGLDPEPADTLEAVLDSDRRARALARYRITEKT
jgi:1-deoxy-D-xylulose-5-phosphate reductoisomerase